MAKAGRRRPKYAPSDCEEIIAFGRQGRSLDAWMASKGITRDVFYGWREKHKEFDAACEISKREALNVFESIGMQAMMGKGDGKNVNVGVWKFFMERRFREFGYGRMVTLSDIGEDDFDV